MYKEMWIPVSTSEGMFSNEYAVLLTLANGEEVSFFVDKNLIIENNNKYLLKTSLIKEYPFINRQLVMLPCETIETNTRWAEVKCI